MRGFGRVGIFPDRRCGVTRRARKHSVLSAVVLKFSTARGRYERQGLLVEESALNQAEAECLADVEARERRAQREREQRAELDPKVCGTVAKPIRELFPNCPAGREVQIAEHACRKYSGRIGRSAAAKSLDEAAVLLAIAAHIRHRQTNYDELLAGEWDRASARAEIKIRLMNYCGVGEAVAQLKRCEETAQSLECGGLALHSKYGSSCPNSSRRASAVAPGFSLALPGEGPRRSLDIDKSGARVSWVERPGRKDLELGYRQASDIVWIHKRVEKWRGADRYRASLDDSE